MKTKFYTLLLCCVNMFAAQQANAQCNDNRYKAKTFTVGAKTTVTYSTPYSLAMDIYQPTGDTSATRPVMILAHGGSFIDGSTKVSDTYVVNMCKEFAKRGYVTASIDYRTTDYFSMADSAKAVTQVLKAISDGKAAIRFFKQDAATTNTYKIDTNRLFIGGNSAGAVLFMHIMYLDSLAEAPPAFRSIITANGGFEGNSGNPGYSTKATALINLAGGLNVPEFVGPGSGPVFNAQGDKDLVVPYGCANAQNGLTAVRLCGLGAVEPLYATYNVNRQNKVYPNEGHTPWATGTHAATETAELDTLIANFLLQFTCATTTGVNEVKNVTEISLFPNPATSELNIRCSEKVTTVNMYNSVGQLVLQNAIESNNGKINTGNLAKGIYHIKIEFADRSFAATTRRIVIE